jgi:MarR family transcriptional regulator, organic hydroperoxide resistance regulator
MWRVTTPAAALSTRRRDPGTEAWEAVGALFMAARGRMLGIARELDLSPPQLIALRFLHDGKPMSELAEVMHCDNSNVTGLVDRLEQRGLVERRAAEHDRRVKLLDLTAEGARVREAIESRLSEPPAGVAALSRADQRALRDIVRRALELG